MQTSKEHWENIYQTKQSAELSWTEDTPRVSLSFFHEFHLPKTANIIDVGGGESKLVDCLLNEGFENITVLDISENSIERAKFRLGEKSSRIKWIVQDVLDFQTNLQFDCWHDRAAFHFLRDKDQINQYASLAKKYIKPTGYIVMGTFSENGPKRCSGLPINQYTPSSLTGILSDGFKKLKCVSYDHPTPFHTMQNFLYCSFRRT